MATIKKVISMDGISKIPELLEIANDNITTDITTDEATAYVYKILSLDSESIRFYEAAGQMAYQRGWYFFVDEEENELMVNQYFNGDKNVAAIYSSKPSKAKNTQTDKATPKPEPEYEDIDDSERYTYYTTPEPEETVEAMASPKATATPDSSATPKITATPESTASPEATATPDSSATPKATATAKPSASPEAAVTPKNTSTPKATLTPEVKETPEAEEEHPAEDEE